MAGALLTTFFVIPEIGENKRFEGHLAPRPAYDALRRVVEYHLGGERMEHVAVLWEGERRDMFVGETSSINGRMVRNIRATEIYHNNVRVHDPDNYDAATAPPVCGPAVLFLRRVWF